MNTQLHKLDTYLHLYVEVPVHNVYIVLYILERLVLFKRFLPCSISLVCSVVIYYVPYKRVIIIIYFISHVILSPPSLCVYEVCAIFFRVSVKPLLKRDAAFNGKCSRQGKKREKKWSSTLQYCGLNTDDADGLPTDIGIAHLILYEYEY